MMNVSLGKTAAVLATSALLFASAAQAQGPVVGMLEACEPEITQYCDAVTPGDGRLMACMYAHEDKLSTTCDAAIVDMADALDFLFANARSALAICAADIEANCADVEFGGGRIMSCLKDANEKISSDCQTQVGAFAQQFGLTD